MANLIQFESVNTIEKNREDLREARGRIIENAKEKYEKDQRRKEQAKLRGEDSWMLASVDKRIAAEEESRKRSKKKKKKEKRKKKEKKKKKKKQDTSSSSSDSSSEEDEEEPKWVVKSDKKKEAKDVNPQGTVKGPRMERDSWMNAPLDLFPTVTRQELINEKNKEKNEIEAQKKLLEQPGRHAKELNPYWKDGGTGLPEEKRDSKPVASGTGDSGLSWLRKSYQRCIEQAKEEGKSVEELAAERWGSHEKILTMISEAENLLGVQRRTNRPGGDRRNRFMKPGDSDRSDSRRERSRRSHSRSPSRHSNSSRYSDRSQEHRKRSRSRSKDRYRRDRSNSPNRKHRSRSRSKDRSRQERSRSREQNRYERPRSRERSRYESQRSKESGSSSSRKRFMKPGEMSDESSKHRSSKSSSSGGAPAWKKKEFQKPVEDDGKRPEKEQRRRQVSSSSSSSASSSSESDSSNSESDNGESSKPKEPKVTYKILSEKEMNDLGAKILKAEIMGNKEQAEILKTQLDAAREARKYMPARGKEVKQKGEEEEDFVVLTRTDRSGMARPVPESKHDREAQSGRRKRIKQKVETHEGKQGERVRYFADDDKFDLNTLVQREKMGTAEDQNSMFARLAGRAEKTQGDDFQVDDIFLTKANRKQAESVEEERDRSRAIMEHRQMASAMEKCHFCFNKVEKHLIVAIGTKVFLCLPVVKSLTEGHCFIVPMQHVSSGTTVDEDIWSEIQLFRKTLTKLFNDRDEDVVFMETCKNLKYHPHMRIECVPVEKETGDMAPIYFKKAMQDTGSEWSENKKVVDISKKDIRHSVPKGFPYFSVDFGNEGGFAHVIEDERTFPSYFGKEIIGGMIDADHTLWRKPHKENFDSQRKKVLRFSEMWKPYDWTQNLSKNAQIDSSSDSDSD